MTIASAFSRSDSGSFGWTGVQGPVQSNSSIQTKEEGRAADQCQFMTRKLLVNRNPMRGNYFSFAYSAFAAMRMGMSGSASFHSVRKS